MPLVIRDTSSVPPERWNFHVEATGFTVYAPNWQALYPMVKTHCESNNVPVPSEQDIINQVCERLSVPCYERETRQALVNRFVTGLPAPAPSCCGSKK